METEGWIPKRRKIVHESHQVGFDDQLSQDTQTQNGTFLTPISYRNIASRSRNNGVSNSHSARDIEEIETFSDPLPNFPTQDSPKSPSSPPPSNLSQSALRSQFVFHSASQTPFTPRSTFSSQTDKRMVFTPSQTTHNEDQEEIEDSFSEDDRTQVPIFELPPTPSPESSPNEWRFTAVRTTQVKEDIEEIQDSQDHPEEIQQFPQSQNPRQIDGDDLWEDPMTPHTPFRFASPSGNHAAELRQQLTVASRHSLTQPLPEEARSPRSKKFAPGGWAQRAHRLLGHLRSSVSRNLFPRQVGEDEELPSLEVVVLEGRKSGSTWFAFCQTSDGDSVGIIFPIEKQREHQLEACVSFKLNPPYFVLRNETVDYPIVLFTSHSSLEPFQWTRSIPNSSNYSVAEIRFSSQFLSSSSLNDTNDSQPMDMDSTPSISKSHLHLYNPLVDMDGIVQQVNVVQNESGESTKDTTSFTQRCLTRLQQNAERKPSAFDPTTICLQETLIGQRVWLQLVHNERW